MLDVRFKLIKTEYGAGSLQLLKISRKLICNSVRIHNWNCFNYDIFNAQVEGEIERRKKLGRDSQRRKKIIITDYKPLHPDVYILQVNELFVDQCQIKNIVLGTNLNLLHICFIGLSVIFYSVLCYIWSPALILLKIRDLCTHIRTFSNCLSTIPYLLLLRKNVYICLLFFNHSYF